MGLKFHLGLAEDCGDSFSIRVCFSKAILSSSLLVKLPCLIGTSKGWKDRLLVPKFSGNHLIELRTIEQLTIPSRGSWQIKEELYLRPGQSNVIRQCSERFAYNYRDFQ